MTAKASATEIISLFRNGPNDTRIRGEILPLFVSSPGPFDISNTKRVTLV